MGNKIKNILVLSKGRILVEINDRKIIISGELSSNNIFYADIKSLTQWEPPFNKETLSVQLIQDLINKIEFYSTDKQIKILFD
jgi:hypothetical protein